MKTSTGHSYRKRLLRVIDYIHDHLDGDLDVNVLAEVALLSPYHFHRIYREMAQETVNATVRRLRLQRAASALIRSDSPLSRIAKDVSYSSQEAFSRAFTKQFGETPSEYRQGRHLSTVTMEPFVAMLPETGLPEIRLPEINLEYVDMYEVEIMDMNEALLVGYEHRGDYMEVGNAFGKLFMYAGSHGLLNEKTRSIGLYYNDPKSTDLSELRSMACISLEQPLESDDENAPQQQLLPAGKCATLLFKGSYPELEKPYDWLFGRWLPESGYEAADFPPFEEYLNDPKRTPPSELLTRIHCLLK